MLTPKDIETKIFKISFRGYDVSEVDDFLQEICDSYVEIYSENKKYQDQIRRLSDAVGQYKSMEETITDAVTVADKSASEIESDAKQKAANIIKNAEITANSIVAGAEQKIADEAYRLDSIKREIEIYKTKIIDLLNAQLSVLKEYPQSGDFKTNLRGEHTQQLWMRKNTEPSDKKDVAENTNNSEKNLKESNISEDTMPIEPVDKTDIADEPKGNAVEKSTQELPCISINDKGEYVVADK